MRTKEKKIYAKWPPERVIEAVNLVQNQGFEKAAGILGLSVASIKIALYRSGVSLSQLRQRRKIDKKKRRDCPNGAFVKPSKNRPFNAMVAIEADTGGCRWPIGDLDKDNFRFCCHEKFRGSFCRLHAAQAYLGTGPIPLDIWLARYDAYQAKMRAGERVRKAAKWHKKMA